MSRKPRVDRSPEEKWQIIQEGIKSGNVSETCRRHGIAPNLFYRWKDEAEQGAKAALGEKSCRGGNREGPAHPAVGKNAGAEVTGERERQARVILGDSERQVAEKFGEAAKTYANDPVALHLRA